MSDGVAGSVPEEANSGNPRLAVLLAMAMFVLVVDTSLMNVSISAVVEDLDTTVSSVQAAIALEALVSAAFILISSKVGDLIGRKRAFVLGLLAYAIGALAMTLAQSVTAIIIFWAIIGGLGASLLLPAMQSLIHGNFEGAARTKTYALVGARCRDRGRGRAAARRLRDHVPLLACRLRARGRRDRGRAVPDQARPRRRLHRAAADRRRRRDPLGVRDGRPRARHSRLAGGRRVRRSADGDRGGRARAARLLARAPQACGEADTARSRSLQVPALHDRDLRAAAAERDAGRRDDRAPDLPADDARVQRDGDGIDPRAALAQHVRRRAARGTQGGRAAPEQHRPASDSPSARSGWR